ncbi:MAG: phage antirepressor KilAC domain-containing protein [Methylotenera sp.]
MKDENNLPVGEQDVFKWLVDSRYIFKNGKGYLPYAKYEANGLNYFTVSIDIIHGGPRRQLKITGNGVVALTGKVVKHFRKIEAA